MSNPSLEGERFIQSSTQGTDPKTTLYVFYGIGLGYHIEGILNLFNEKIDAIAYEPFEELQGSEELQSILSEIQKKFATSNSSFGIIQSPKIEKSKLLGKKSLQLIIHPFYKRNLKEKYEKFSEELFKQFQPETNKSTIGFFSRIWLKNYSINLRELQNREFFFLKNNSIDLKNKIVMFAGASPGLESDIFWIQEHRQYLFLITSDTSSYFLYKNNILPDIVLSIDSGRGTAFHFRNDFPESVPILTWIGGNSEIFRKKNPLIIYFSTYPLDQILAELNCLSSCVMRNPSLNVAGLAKELTSFFGGKEIIFSGISFLSEGFKTHCRGTGYENYSLPGVNRKKSLESLASKIYQQKMSVKNKLALEELMKSPNLNICLEPGKANNYVMNFSKPGKSFYLEKGNLQLDKFFSILSDEKAANELRNELSITKEIWKKFFISLKETFDM